MMLPGFTQTMQGGFLSLLQPYRSITGTYTFVLYCILVYMDAAIHLTISISISELTFGCTC